MKDPKQVKEWAQKRLTFFMRELDESDDPFDTEATLYSIMRTAENGYKRMYEVNKKALS